MAIKEAIEALSESIECCKADAEKFAKGNDAAGKRIPACLMEVSKACKELRSAIQSERNARKG